MEAVKAPVQARLKPAQQPFIKEKVKDGVVENIMELPRDNSRTQVVVFEVFSRQLWVVVRVEKVVLMVRIILRRKSQKEIISVFL